MKQVPLFSTPAVFPPQLIADIAHWLRCCEDTSLDELRREFPRVFPQATPARTYWSAAMSAYFNLQE